MLACAGDASAKRGKSKKMNDYENAVALLASPDTWCQGAERLAKIGDAAALVPLARAWWSRHEGGKGCLADAMEALGGARHAKRLLESGDAEERDVGLELMALFSSDDHVEPLERAITSHAEPGVRVGALRVLVQQKRTETWERAMIRLLDADDLAVRTAAVEGLERRKGDAVKAALRARLGKEPDPGLKKRIEAALAPH